MTRGDGPPGWIEAVLGTCLPAGEVRDGVIGDLAEDFVAVVAARGRAVAVIWYSTQASRIGVRYLGRWLWRTLARQEPPTKIIPGNFHLNRKYRAALFLAFCIFPVLIPIGHMRF